MALPLESFKESEIVNSRLAAIVDSSDDAIISKTLEGIIITWNEGARRIFGYEPAEVIGKHITILLPKDRLNEEVAIIERIKAGDRVEHYETIRCKKDGSLLNISLTISPVKNAKGEIVGASKIARDITARKQIEEELRTLAEERAGLLDAERAARSEAERLNLIKDEFLATLSHELRTPLNAIVGWAQLLLSGRAKPEDTKNGLEIIQKNARIQTQLIEDLLDMSRIISAKVRLDVQRVELPPIVDTAIEAVKPSAEAKEIKITKIIDPNAGPVSGDPTRLQQIIWNLLSNSIKFTNKGGKVDIILEKIDSRINLTIRDNGIGIRQEVVNQIFERFRQADSSTTRRYGGLGLGLSISKHLVELHGGTIRVESEGEGKGATFIVALPVSPFKNRLDEKLIIGSSIDDEPNLSGIKVLVVDDENDARDLVSRVLTQCYAIVTTASSAEEAMKILNNQVFDIIVSDIGMPGKDGYQLISEVRKLPANKGGRIPAIALTAFARSEDRTRAMRAGYQIHLSKPIEPQELVVAVSSLKKNLTGA